MAGIFFLHVLQILNCFKKLRKEFLRLWRGLNILAVPAKMYREKE